MLLTPTGTVNSCCAPVEANDFVTVGGAPAEAEAGAIAPASSAAVPRSAALWSVLCMPSAIFDAGHALSCRGCSSARSSN